MIILSNWAKLQEDLVGLPVAKRAKHGIHFQKVPGEFVANFSGKPCHYEDGGIWKPIDTRLIVMPDGWYGAPHSDVRIHPDGRVKVEGANYQQRAELPTAQGGLLDGDRIVRKFAFGEQSLFMLEDGFRSEIILTRVPTNAEAKKLIAAESGGLPGKYRRSDTTATDADGDVHEYKSLGAFQKWLAKAVYPVVIDPDFAGGTGDNYILGQNADYTTARSTSSSTNNTGNVICGQRTRNSSNLYYVWRGFLLFDTSSIDDGGTVTQANLSLAVVVDYSNDYDIDVQIVKQNWTGTREADYDGCLSGDADDSIWRNTNGISLNTQYASGNLSTAWVSKTGTTYYSLRSSRDYNGDHVDLPANSLEWVEFASADHATESYRPVLTVTYTAAGGASYVPTINMVGQMQNLNGLRG